MLVEHGPGVDGVAGSASWGTRGVESCELAFDGYRIGVSAILGGAAGSGFCADDEGVGDRADPGGVAGVGVATAALEDSLAYAQQRESFGQPIWKHQSIGNYLPIWPPS